MATPPFNPNELSPGDSDLVSQYPANERTFRDIVEDWINTEHDPSGHHKLPINTTAGLAAVADWAVGSIGFDSDLNVLKVVRTLGPTTFSEIGLEKNTRAVFQQTAAPLGWTKETNALYNDAAIKGTTGTVGTGGTTVFSTRFADTGNSFTIAQANLPALGVITTSSNGAHLHNTTAVPSNSSGNIFAGGSSGPIPNSPIGIASDTQGAHTHTFDLGGSGTSITLPLNVKNFSTIVATKA